MKNKLNSFHLKEDKLIGDDYLNYIQGVPYIYQLTNISMIMAYGELIIQILSTFLDSWEVLASSLTYIIPMLHFIELIAMMF